MRNERIEMLEGLLKSKISTILLENFPADAFNDAVILDGSCDITELNGHYEETEFCPPEWYKRLKNSEEPILVISDINKIPVQEQKKFIEILKYKKVSTFDLPKNCVIIVTAKNLEENKINEEVYSLMAHV